MALKALILVDQFPPAWGSLSIRADLLVQALVRSGFYVTVVAPVKGGQVDERVKVIGIPSPGKKGGTLSRLRKYAVEFAGAVVLTRSLEKHDIVISSVPQYLLGIAGWILARRWKVPHIVEVRDLWPHSIVIFKNNVRSRIMWRVIYAIADFIFKRADYIVVTNDVLKDELISNYRLKKDKVAVIPGAYEVKNFSPLPDVPRFFYGGNLGFSQNPVLLVDVAEELSNLIPEAIIEVAGNGSMRDQFLRRLSERNCKNIRYLGTLPREKVIQKITSSYACIVMLRNSSGLRSALPGKLIEAMACGRPVVASLSGAGEDVLRKANAGIVVAPESPVKIAEALCWLWENRSRAEEMGKNGIRYVMKHHSEVEFRKKYIQVIRSLQEKCDGQKDF